MCNCGGSFRKNIISSPPKQPNIPNNTTIDMKSRIISLWKGVINGETYAKAEFIRIYLQRFPHNKHLTENLSKENLHRMYVDLTR